MANKKEKGNEREGKFSNITITVATKAAIEASPTLRYKINKAKATCKTATHGSCMYQQNSPTLEASTVNKFTISPLL
ncbi:hypothetical protein Ahy_B01g052136 isoform G [Arachis hypogaea]|uniref:Uncharacterized protein n=1 Tax=Arachis hypogaea TaxID=3818 RepID=A0A445ANL6_ARAHY|nr:hypothetical protein Ahy_B01g052136 isoform G [Arachis hypogaea]